MYRTLSSLAFLICGLLAAAPSADAGLKDLINESVRTIRGLQNEDGSYGPAGEKALATALVLQAMGDCHEHYTTQDGPFVRNAVDFLINLQTGNGSFASEVDPRVVTLTAEILLALEATAHVAEYSASRTRAVEYLEQLTPEQIKKEAAVALVSRALLGPAPQLVHVPRYLEEGDSLDSGGNWLEFMSERLSVAQERELAGLKPAGIPSVARRLLALIETYAVEKSLAKSDSELPPITRRALPADHAEELARIRQALQFLQQAQSEGRFGFGSHMDPGITGLALSAVIRTCTIHSLDRPEYVETGLEWLVSLQKEDGGIYQFGLKNYVTSVAVEALVAAGDPRHQEVIDRATTFLKVTQLDEDQGYSAEEDPYYGGFGYGGSQKPDLSNTQMALQALHEAGVPKDDEAFSKAVTFLKRCQNRPESGAPTIVRRDGTEIVAGTDGGAVYRPGDSKAGTDGLSEGKAIARSYGSMTYALLKSYLFAGIDPDAPEVQDAIRWIGENYTVEVNPGFKAARIGDAYQGLYYYYLTLARALRAYGQDLVVDAEGVEHDWRRDLREMLFSVQSEDGSWTNVRSMRWMEGNPVLATSYALLALKETERAD